MVTNEKRLSHLSVAEVIFFEALNFRPARFYWLLVSLFVSQIGPGVLAQDGQALQTTSLQS
jgi:hypothetical protein